METKIERIAKLTTWFVGVLAFGALSLSFNALREIAAANGFEGWRSLVWPLLLDAGLIVFSLVVVLNSLRGERTWDTWLLVSAFTIGTIGFNLSHADKTVLSRLMSVVPPLTLFLTFERLMSLFRSDVQRRGAIQSLTNLLARVKELTAELTTVESAVTTARANLTTIDGQAADKRGQIDKLNRQADDIAADIATGQETLSSLESEIADAEKRRLAALARLGSVQKAASDLSVVADGDKLAKPQRQPIVLRLTKEGFDPAAIAERLSTSERTIRRDLSELNGQVTRHDQ